MKKNLCLFPTSMTQVYLMHHHIKESTTVTIMNENSHIKISPSIDKKNPINAPSQYKK